MGKDDKIVKMLLDNGCGVNPEDPYEQAALKAREKLMSLEL
jgi:hypothetical protein